MQMTIENELTNAELIEYLLYQGNTAVQGTVRTKQTCPICNGQFIHLEKLGLICKKHKTIPTRFFVDISYKGRRIKIYSNNNGTVLDSYGRAVETLEHINYEMRHHQFDPTKYVKKDVKRFLFENLIKDWFHAKSDLTSVFKYRQVYNRYFGFFTGMDVREIRTSHVHEFYQHLPNKLSNKTKKNVLDTLRAFMFWAFNLEYIEKLPIFPVIKIDLKIPQWMREKEQGEVLSFLPQSDRFIYLFLMLHGCRPSEARALQVQDISFENGSIVFRRVFTGRSGNTLVERTKTARQRVIPVNPDMEHILRDLCKDKLPGDFVFTDSKTGRPYPSRTLIKRWQAACKKAGKKIGLYAGSKHSWASQRVSKGLSIYLISKVLGHTNIKTTERYALIDVEGMRNIMSISES